jgi:uncharacterized phage-associated protein
MGLSWLFSFIHPNSSPFSEQKSQTVKHRPQAFYISWLFKLTKFEFGYILVTNGGHMQEIRAQDVAKYILKKCGEMTTLKLQKLLYYCQAWSLVWDEEPLFEEEIEAWANGPVVRSVFAEHRLKFKVGASDIRGNTRLLTQKQRETIDAVINYYGDKDSYWLTELSHMEDPWKNARGDLPPGVRSQNVITKASMMEYYSSLV